MIQRAILTNRIRTAIRRLLGQGGPPLHNRTSFAPGAIPGSLVSDVFDKIRLMPGWFNFDDCSHFTLVLGMQHFLGVTGDLLEIGSFHGRSTCVLAHCMQPGEKLVVCDAFERASDGHYHVHATRERLLTNLRLVNPDLAPNAIVVHECYSTDLKLDSSQRFRFAHVDGGHSKDIALHDLKLCAAHMLPGGVIAVDDYAHRDFPEVSEAVDEFLAERLDYRVLADLNRDGAIGRKIYLCRESDK